MGVSSDRSRPWWSLFALRLKLCSNITALIAIELLLILIVLKLGDTHPFGAWTWTLVTVPPIAGAVAMLIFGRCVHYYSCHDYQYLGSLRSSSELGSTYLLHLDVERLENYHETALFRDVLLGMAYAVFIGLAINLYTVPCTGCHTPYQMLGIGIIVTYGLRLLLLVYHNIAWYQIMRQLCRELRKYQSFFDDQRLFQSVLPDLHVRTRSRLLEGFLFLATVALAALASIWVQQGHCTGVCPRVVKCSSYLLGGIYILECFYLVSETVLAYFHRTQGMENVETLTKRVYKDRQAAKREAVLDNENKKQGRAK